MTVIAGRSQQAGVQIKVLLVQMLNKKAFPNQLRKKKLTDILKQNFPIGLTILKVMTEFIHRVLNCGNSQEKSNIYFSRYGHAERSTISPLWGTPGNRARSGPLKISGEVEPQADII